MMWNRMKQCMKNKTGFFKIIITFAAAQYCGKFEDLKEEKMEIDFFEEKRFEILSKLCV